MREIPSEQIIERLKFENPWWGPPHAIEEYYARMTRRAYFDAFFELVRDTEVRRAVILMGPRRVGKTVMVYHAIQALIDSGVSPASIAYVSVEHPLYNGLSLETLLEYCRQAAGVTTTAPFYIVFDEIQYLREWERHLKVLVDSHPNVKCVALGSAAAALRLKSIESGAGRFTDFLLPPLTFHEFLLLKGKQELVEPVYEEDTERAGAVTRAVCGDVKKLNTEFFEYLNFGGYPEVIFSPRVKEDPSRFIRNDIIDKVLLRDLPSLYGIQDIQELNSLFTRLAYNTGEEVSLQALSQESGVSKATIKRYIEYLEAAFLIRTVQRIDRSAKRFKRANFFKVYLTNPSMHSALFAPIDHNSEHAGHLVETAIFAQWFHSDAWLHYARWGGGEVDSVFLDDLGRPQWAMEVKWSDAAPTRAADVRGLLAFCHEHNLPRATLTSRTVRGVVTLQNVAIGLEPAAIYCFLVGFNSVRQR